MTDTTAGAGEVVAMPTQTRVVGQDGSTILTFDGLVLLPLGSRIELDDAEGAASVVGIRLVDATVGAPVLVLEVDAGGSSFDPAALREAEAELEVVEAAEDITAQESDPTDALRQPIVE